MEQAPNRPLLGLAIDRLYGLLDGYSSQRQEVVRYDMLKTVAVSDTGKVVLKKVRERPNSIRFDFRLLPFFFSHLLQDQQRWR